MKKILFMLALLVGAVQFIQAQAIASEPCPTEPTGPVIEGTTTQIPIVYPDPADPEEETPEGPTAEKDRMVIWVHGLGGGPGAWEKPADSTEAGGTPTYPARKVKSNRPTYSEATTLVAAGGTLNTAIDNFSTTMLATGTVLPTDQTFIIAHSQGGLVSRAAGSIGTTGGTLFGGIVTFDSPHGGALIANNLTLAPPFMFKFCTDLLAGPQSNGFLLPLNSLGITVGDICALLPAFVTSNFAKPVLADYAVGASGITGLGDGNVSHKIMFSGVEAEEVLWRELFHLIKEPSNYPIFEANDQVKGQNAANTLKKFWHSMAKLNVYIGNPKVAAQWYKGRDALSVANAQWKVLIGGTVKTVVFAPACVCTIWNANDDPDSTYTTPIPSGGGGCPANTPGANGSYTTCMTGLAATTTTTFIPNDGIVTQTSQLAFPGAAMGITLMGSNHQSVRNDANTRTSLLSVFNGTAGGKIWFFTEQR